MIPTHSLRPFVRSVFVAAAYAAWSAPPAAPLVFRNPVYPVPGENNVIQVGDFNGDGHLDVVTTNSFTRDLSVLFGDGRGGLSPEVRVTVEPGGLAVGDFDGDGYDDIAVVSYADDSLAVVLSRGDGTFGDPVRYAVGAAPMAVVAADFDGDGVLDLATANYTSNDVSVLLGRGDGSFGSPASFAVGSHPGSLVAGEFNGDGKIDLAVANGDSRDVSILLGRGDGTFFPQSVISDVEYVLSIAAADLDGDGRDDLATMSRGVCVYMNRGDGTFRRPDCYDPGYEARRSLRIADVTSDGRLDLVVAGPGGIVLPGNGDGTFGAPVSFRGGAWSFDLAVGDFDGDGKQDLVTANGFERNVSILLGNGDGTSASTFPVDAFPLAIVKNDFNGDGLDDLVTANEDGGSVSVLLGTTAGGFEPARRVIFQYPPFFFPLSVATGDLDGDGKPDLAVGGAGLQTTEIRVLYGDGEGSFAPPIRLEAAVNPFVLAVADFNGDGKDDLVTASYYSVDVYLSNSRGDFEPVSGTSPGFPRALLADDFDGDGKIDLAVGSSWPSGAEILLGNGDGTFRDVGRVPMDSTFTGFARGDLDGDGIPDLIMLGDGVVMVNLGNGDGSFGPPSTYWTSGYTAWGVVADFNRDGVPDLAVGEDFFAVRVFLGSGRGNLTMERDYDGGEEVLGAVAGDFNGDGKPDLAISCASSNRVTVLYNRFDRPPVAHAGRDQLLECTGNRESVATLDGSESTDLDSTHGTNDDIVRFDWSEAGASLGSRAIVSIPFRLGTHDVALTVKDKAGATDTDNVLITVRDTQAPAGTILAPPPLACFGPGALPVTVSDNFADVCDPSVLRSYDPAPGPSYAQHGDHHVTLTARDGSNNAATAGVDFTIDLVPPVVTILSPPDQAFLPSSLGFKLLFKATDDDGARGGIVHEVVKIAGCTAYDGLTYGNRDGLLEDESILLTLAELCRISALCGFNSLVRPVLRVEATDCGGNVGVATRQMMGGVALRPGICGN